MIALMWIYLVILAVDQAFMVYLVMRAYADGTRDTMSKLLPKIEVFRGVTGQDIPQAMIFEMADEYPGRITYDPEVGLFQCLLRKEAKP